MLHYDQDCQLEFGGQGARGDPLFGNLVNIEDGPPSKVGNVSQM